MFPWRQAHSVMSAWTEAASSDDALDVAFGALHTPAGLVLVLNPTWAADPDRGDASISRLRALGDPVIDHVGRMTMAAAVHLSDELVAAPGSYVRHRARFRGSGPAALAVFLQIAEQMPAESALMVHHAHGAATRVPPSQTAFVYREEHLVVEIIGCWRTGNGARERAWVDAAGRALDPWALPGGWANVMGSDDERAEAAFGANTERLREIKRRWDPDHVFSALPLC